MATCLFAIAVAVLANPLKATATGCRQGLARGRSIRVTSTLSIESDGLVRSYLILNPSEYSTSEPNPIIFSYHGGTKSAEDQSNIALLTTADFNMMQSLFTHRELMYVSIPILPSVHNSGAFVNLLGCD